MASYDDGLAGNSRLLYELCCDVGFSRQEWKRRVLHNDAFNTITTYGHLYKGYSKCYALSSGSRAEGLGTNWLGSDVDMMLILKGTRVIQDDYVHLDDPDNIFKMVPTKHPAFVRLHLLHIGRRRDWQLFLTPVFCALDETGSQVLNGKIMKMFIIPPHLVAPFGLTASVSHGPAETITHELSPEVEKDVVLSLHCEAWPAVSEEWIHRHRRYNWPTHDLIKEIIEKGCELVPVGNPLSGGRDLEWRLSSSLAEKILLRSFSTVQMQCYFLLKLILTFLIKPHIKDALCSYHMKTVMLHMVESTDPREWREDNLTSCFMACLQKLLTCLKEGHLPQFFIPSQNLLHPKVQGPIHQRVLDIVENLYTEGWTCVLRCAPLTNIGLSCDHKFTRCPCYVRHWKVATAELASGDMVEVAMCFAATNLSLLKMNSVPDLVESIQRLICAASPVESTHNTFFPCASLLRRHRRMLSSHIGYALLCVTRKQPPICNRKIWQFLKISERLLKENCDVDMTSCRLKLATFYLQTGRFHRCIQTVQDILRKYLESALPVCPDIYRLHRYTSNQWKNLIVDRLSSHFGSISKLLRQVAFPVSFCPSEIVCAPPGVQELVFTRQLSMPWDRHFFKTISIDPLPYAYSLLFMANIALEKPDEVRRNLHRMQRVVRNPRSYMLFYPESANQLFEYCLRCL